MKIAPQRGQALVEYLLALSLGFLAVLAGLKLLHAGLESYWDKLALWTRFPTP